MSSITLASLQILITSDGEDARYLNVTLINLLLVEDFCERLPLWFSNIDFKVYIYPDNEFHYIITSRVTSNLSKLSIRNGYDQYVNIPKPVTPFPKNNKIDYWLKWKDFSDD